MYLFKIPILNNVKKLIPHKYEALATYVNKRIEESNFVSISTDSWTDINGKNIMNFIVHTPKPFLYSFEDISSESETGELVADHLIKIIVKRFEKSSVHCDGQRQSNEKKLAFGSNHLSMDPGAL